MAWAKVLGNPRNNQFDPDNRIWTVDLIVDKDVVKKLKTEGLGWKLNKTEQDNTWAPEGSDFIKFKRMEFFVDRKTGEKKKNKPIEVIDGAGNPWDQETLIGNGSKVNIRFRTYEGFKKQTQTMIDAIQVVELVSYQAKEEFPVYKTEKKVFDFDDNSDDPKGERSEYDEVIV